MQIFIRIFVAKDSLEKQEEVTDIGDNISGHDLRRFVLEIEASISSARPTCSYFYSVLDLTKEKRIKYIAEYLRLRNICPSGIVIGYIQDGITSNQEADAIRERYFELKTIAHETEQHSIRQAAMIDEALVIGENKIFGLPLETGLQ